MIELLIKLIEKLVELKKEDIESSKRFFEIEIGPILEHLENLNNDYLQTFREYRNRFLEREFDDWEHFSSVIRGDSLLSLHLRQSIFDYRDELFKLGDPNLKKLIALISEYDFSRMKVEYDDESNFQSEASYMNNARFQIINGLDLLFSVKLENEEKQEMALVMIDHMIERVQGIYIGIRREIKEIERRVLN